MPGVESQSHALPLSSEPSKDFRAGSVSPAAKPSKQWGEATKPWVARPRESHRLGRGATRLLCLLGQPPEQWDEEENQEHPRSRAVNPGRKGLLGGRRPAPGLSEWCAQKNIGQLFS